MGPRWLQNEQGPKPGGEAVGMRVRLKWLEQKDLDDAVLSAAISQLRI